MATGAMSCSPEWWPVGRSCFLVSLLPLWVGKCQCRIHTGPSRFLKWLQIDIQILFLPFFKKSHPVHMGWDSGHTSDQGIGLLGLKVFTTLIQIELSNPGFRGCCFNLQFPVLACKVNFTELWYSTDIHIAKYSGFISRIGSGLLVGEGQTFFLPCCRNLEIISPHSLKFLVMFESGIAFLEGYLFWVSQFSGSNPVTATGSTWPGLF